MKKSVVYFLIIFTIFTQTLTAQTKFKEFKAGHTFNINLPEYMTKTVGINSASIIQYKSVVKDVYGFVIVDTKEELEMAEMKYSSLMEFYENFIKDFVKDEEKRTVSTAKSKTIGDINFIESDVTYYDKEVKSEIYYLIGIVETKTAYYQVLGWTGIENKDKLKADLQKILYSIND